MASSCDLEAARRAPNCVHCTLDCVTLQNAANPPCAAVLQEVDVSVNTQLRQALQQATGQRTVPQVRIRMPTESQTAAHHTQLVLFIYSLCCPLWGWQCSPRGLIHSTGPSCCELHWPCILPRHASGSLPAAVCRCCVLCFMCCVLCVVCCCPGVCERSAHWWQ